MAKEVRSHKFSQPSRDQRVDHIPNDSGGKEVGETGLFEWQQEKFPPVSPHKIHQQG